MPEGWLQRRFTRFPLELPLQYQVPGHPISGVAVGWTHNLGGGGACVELAEPLQRHVSFGLQLHIPGGQITEEAQVLWARTLPPAEGGILHGIAFTHSTPDQIEALHRLLLSLQMWRRTRVRFPINLAVSCQLQRPPGPLRWGRASDLSRGGLSLHHPEVLLPGTALDITVPTPNGRLKLGGKIAWVEPLEERRPGELIRHGVRFPHLEWSTALLLARLLTESRESPQWLPPKVSATVH
jgi:hypothetical protein